jgi:hypothetical protein
MTEHFTSVVDRDRKSKRLRHQQGSSQKLQEVFIAVTCHYDVVDWLDPDWVFCTDTMEFYRKKKSAAR